MFIFYLFAELLIAQSTPGAGCVFEWNNLKYDFSQLSIPIPSSDGVVSMGLCANNADRGMMIGGGPACEEAMINQFFSTNHAGCNSYLAKWDGSHVVGALSDTTGQQDGVSLTFNNGQDFGCPDSSPRKVTIDFVCSTTGDEQNFKMTEEATCVYEILYKTKSGCNVGPADSKPNNESSSLSGGWVFIIILLCLTFVYCVGGMAYNYKYDDSKQGLDLVPQRTLWTGIMEYTILGCNVSWSFTRNKYFEYCTKDRSYSVDDSEGPYTGRKFSSAGV